MRFNLTIPPPPSINVQMWNVRKPRFIMNFFLRDSFLSIVAAKKKPDFSLILRSTKTKVSRIRSSLLDISLSYWPLQFGLTGLILFLPKDIGKIPPWYDFSTIHPSIIRNNIVQTLSDRFVTAWQRSKKKKNRKKITDCEKRGSK